MCPKYCVCYTNEFGHAIKHVHMSQSASPATRKEARQPLKHPKMTLFATFTIGTELRRHDRTQTTRRHTGGEQRSNPQTPNYKREPFATLLGKNKSKWRKQYTSLLQHIEIPCASQILMIGLLFKAPQTTRPTVTAATS